MLRNLDKIKKQIEASIDVKTKLLSFTEEIAKAGEMASISLSSGGKLMLCGNGGSAADAQHIAAELIIRYKSDNERPPLPAMTLSGDPSTITACSNDYGYEKLFTRQVEAWGRPGDLFIGISTSGNSKNIINALVKAKEMNCKTLTLLGGTGGLLKGQADHEIIIPSHTTARIQESHIMIGHIICSIIEKELFNLD